MGNAVSTLNQRLFQVKELEEQELGQEALGVFR